MRAAFEEGKKKQIANERKELKDERKEETNE